MRWWSCVLVLCLFGCGAIIPKPSNYSTDPKPLLMSIAQRAESIRSISGEVRVEIWKKGQRVKLKQMLAVDSQSRLRLEVISPFGQPITTLVSDGSRLMIYAVDEKRFLMGAATAENMARLMPVNMSPSELSALLRGSIPLIKFQKAEVDWDQRKGRYLLTLKSGDRRQRLELEPEYFRVTRMESLNRQELIYRVRFGTYSGQGKAIVPKRILFEVPSADLRVDLEVLDFTMNPQLPDAAFTLQPPRGISVESM